MSIERKFGPMAVVFAVAVGLISGIVASRLRFKFPMPPEGG
jgi:hypothetical protein